MTLKWLSSYAPVDEEFDNVSLLLHGDGTNGSTTIVDSSSRPKAVTAVGNAQISTAQSKFGGASLAFDGTGDWLQVPDGSDFTLGSDNFTVECWIYNNTTGQFKHIVGQGDSSAIAASASFYFYKSNTNKLVGAIYASNAGYLATSSAELPLNLWTHVAFARDGNTTTVYINGVADGTANVTGVTVNNSTSELRVGAAGEYVNDTWQGYIDDLRITKGVARYTQDFTPPTAPFPDLSPNGRVTIEDNSLDVDARQYIINVEEQDGQPLESGVRTAINDFVVGCKSDGIWNAIKASCILAGARTLDGALVPLVGGAPTNNNFVSGDYDRETGLVGDGSTKYLDSNRNNNADPQNSNHNAVYATSLQATNTVLIAAADPATAAGAGGNGLFTLGASRCRANAASTTPVLPPAPGLLGFSRSIGSQYTLRYSGQNNTIAIVSDGLLSQNVLVYRRQSPAPGYTTSRLAFYSIGESLPDGPTKTGLELLDERVSNLITAIGAAIP